LPSFKKAADDASGVLDGISATETASAFNDETHKQTERHAYAFPFLSKYWDSTLDKRACPRCSDLNGTMRPWGVDFDGGAVPSVHANCRCRVGNIYFPVPIP
jgi:hypothetical protein